MNPNDSKWSKFNVYFQVGFDLTRHCISTQGNDVSYVQSYGIYGHTEFFLRNRLPRLSRMLRQMKMTCDIPFTYRIHTITFPQINPHSNQLSPMTHGPWPILHTWTSSFVSVKPTPVAPKPWTAQSTRHQCCGRPGRLSTPVELA